MSRARRAKIPAQNDDRAKSAPVGHVNARLSTASTKLNLLWALLLACAAVVLYLPVAKYPFVVLDDHDYVTANPHIRGGLSWSTIKWALGSTYASNWHPLTWLSHALDYQLFALDPAGHHLHGILLHALNAAILFLLLAWITRRTGPSLFVAVLFAVHPLNVESVAWVAERKNVLSTLYFLLSLAAYAWYAKRPGLWRYLLVAVLFAAGLMAKPMLVTLPFVLLLLDYWPLGRVSLGSALLGASIDSTTPQLSISRLLLEKVPLLAISAASAVITLKAQRAGRAVRTLYQFSFAARLENAIVSYALYLWKMLWPQHLAIAYPYAAAGLPAWQWVTAGLVLASITALVIIHRQHRYLLVGWLWFLGTLVPVIGLVQVGDAAMADRYAYIPLIGIFIIIAWGIADLSDQYLSGKRKISLIWRYIAALCVVIPLAVVTRQQMTFWQSEYDLWTRSLAITQENPFAHDALGAALMDPQTVMSKQELESIGSDEKRLQAAQEHLNQALAIRRRLAVENPYTYLPDMAVTLNNMGNLARLEDHGEQARKYYEESAQIHSRLAEHDLDPYPADRAMVLTNLGYLERSTAENDKALSHFDASLEIYRSLAKQDPGQFLPNVAEVLTNRAVIEKAQQHLADARRDYEEALRIRRAVAASDRDALPELAMILNDLGVLDQAETRVADAQQHYAEALALYRQLAQQDPDAYLRYLAGALNNIGFLYQNQSRVQEARTNYQEALKLYRKLYSSDPNQYAGDVARVEAGLRQIEKIPPH